ncbi:hypothetical protein K0M31_015857 [Melipona bicolor]|uniref:Uncharacterized protein n=1 Tax=Melipona bicolor TaxID=60889 RepID=A0AA40KT61_9HYME|nr:hypothetical protein K0M31_015857 [Melipona bicolor]
MDRVKRDTPKRERDWGIGASKKRLETRQDGRKMRYEPQCCETNCKLARSNGRHFKQPQNRGSNHGVEVQDFKIPESDLWLVSRSQKLRVPVPKISTSVKDRGSMILRHGAREGVTKENSPEIGERYSLEGLRDQYGGP